MNSRHYNDNNKYNYYNNKFQNDIVKKRLVNIGTGCPNCIYNNENDDVVLDERNIDENDKDSKDNQLYLFNDQSTKPKIGNEFIFASDKLRLESIRHQILNKLGMKSPPTLSNKLPSELVIDTLRRSESVNKASTDKGPISLPSKDTNEPKKSESTSSSKIFQDKVQKLSWSSALTSTSSELPANNPSLTNLHDTASTSWSSSIKGESESHIQKDQNSNDNFDGHTDEIITFAEQGMLIDGNIWL